MELSPVSCFWVGILSSSKKLGVDPVCLSLMLHCAAGKINNLNNNILYLESARNKIVSGLQNLSIENSYLQFFFILTNVLLLQTLLTYSRYSFPKSTVEYPKD